LPKVLRSDLKVDPYKMQMVQQLTNGDKVISLSHLSIWLRVMAAAVAGPNDSRILNVGKLFAHAVHTTEEFQVRIGLRELL
jgi:hypothetical protein